MKHSESRLQRACITWFRHQHPKLTIFAIPNGGKRGVIEASIMKGEGVLAGVADLFLAVGKRTEVSTLKAHSNGQHLVYNHGYFIEMKIGNGKQTEHQKSFQKAVEEQGYKYSVVRSLDEFISVINEYLK